MPDPKVIVIGAGIAGLVAALRLAEAGIAVTVLERGAAPGGKMRALPVGNTAIEAGPTVFTMRWVFDELFAECGESLDDHVRLTPARLLARHAWGGGERLDLFADIDASAEAIAAFAGAQEADGYRRFCARAAETYRTLEGPFLRSEKPGPIDLARRAGLSGLPDLWRIQPFATLWRALGTYFRDPRLRQLFGRYATYCGASPFSAPATLMLVAHVEQAGVWLVEGGLSRLASTLARLAAARGVVFRYGCAVSEILVEGSRAHGVRLAHRPGAPGEGRVGLALDAQILADAVVFAGDVAALGAGLLGADAAPAGDHVRPGDRSLSAVTFCMMAEIRGFPLAHHTVFFSNDYAREFETLERERRLPEDPTVYACAQDRAEDRPDPTGVERLFLLVNAPPDGDCRPFPPLEIERCEANLRRRLAASGLTLEQTGPSAITNPEVFSALFPGTGGALYGRASHGWSATFKRPGARSRIPGLYLAGGSVHPGPGVPMAAQSGRLAAAALLTDLASTARSRRAAMSGGTSMR